MTHQSNIGNIYLNAKDTFQATYQLLIDKPENVCSKNYNFKYFFEYSLIWVLTKKI